MMKIIKKNQLTILVLALMLVTAGYLNYDNKQNITTATEIASIGDATLVNSNAITENTSLIENNEENNSLIENNEENNSLVENTEENSIDNNESITTESNISDSNNYYTSARLDRDRMYSEMLESYQKILDSTTTSNNQKDEAQKEIISINKNKNSIMITENLIKTKGFEDCVVYLNDTSVNVIIKKDKLSKEDTAQIQSIVAREMSAKISNIHIMTK